MRQLRQCIDALKDGGLTVYLPAVREGVCTSPYCVVQPLGSFPSGGTGYSLLRIHIYAPAGRFAVLEEQKRKAENAMKPLVESGAVRPCEGVSACAVDDTFKAYAVYLDYRVQYGLDG